MLTVKAYSASAVVCHMSCQEPGQRERVAGVNHPTKSKKLRQDHLSSIYRLFLV